MIKLQIIYRTDMLMSRNRSAAETNWLQRRISKKILWAKVPSDQLTQQNPQQELSGSEVSVTQHQKKGFNDKKERHHSHY